jgi:predicted nuclease of predicted toxin-antitoxin system
MLPSMSVLKPRFLLDENVHRGLLKFLESQGVDVCCSPKGAVNGTVAALSKKEGLVLVTNDSDFAWYPSEKVFAIVWLRIAQDDVEGLLDSFASLLAKFKGDFEGKLIVLEKDSWEVFPLASADAFAKYA